MTAVHLAAPYAVQGSICCLMMAEVWTCCMSWSFLSILMKHKSSWGIYKTGEYTVQVKVHCLALCTALLRSCITCLMLLVN